MSLGNPSAGGDVRIKYEKRQCRVVRDGWYHEGAPVSIGQKIELPAPDALSNRALGRVEFVH